LGENNPAGVLDVSTPGNQIKRGIGGLTESKWGAQKGGRFSLIINSPARPEQTPANTGKEMENGNE